MTNCTLVLQPRDAQRDTALDAGRALENWTLSYGSRDFPNAYMMGQSVASRVISRSHDPHIQCLRKKIAPDDHPREFLFREALSDVKETGIAFNPRLASRASHSAGRVMARVG